MIVSRNRGFTLIELLVVVAVIGLLTAILVPSLRSAKVQARRAVCGTHLRQIGVAMQAYLGENNDRFPAASWLPSAGPFPLSNDQDPLFIADVLKPHVGGNEVIFKCPSDRPGRVDRPEPVSGLSYYETERSSYEYRSRLRGQTIAEAANRIERHLTNSPTADNTIWIMRDYNNFHRHKRKTSVDGGEFDDVSSPDYPGQRNYLFSDGHVGDYEKF